MVIRVCRKRKERPDWGSNPPFPCSRRALYCGAELPNQFVGEIINSNRVGEPDGAWDDKIVSKNISY